MKNQLQEDVRTFQEVCGQATRHTVGDSGLEPPSHLAILYRALVEEEFTELMDEWDAGNIVGVADGAGDLIWVVLGLCNALGINISPVWDEIRASNMSKTVDGKVIRRDDGKILKPDTYFKPNIAKALGLAKE
jgi:NTP pyrophosphatase (non-canonical NTP hydrolase)